MQTPSRFIRVQSLVGRRVYDAGGKKLGRVYEIEAEADGQELRVKSLNVGAGVWLERFGWTLRSSGQTVPWEEIAELHPVIRLKGTSGRAQPGDD